MAIAGRHSQASGIEPSIQLNALMETKSKAMKVFYVADNSIFLNWGRGASIALAELLSRLFEITGRVTSDFFVLKKTEISYVNTFMPAKYHRLFMHLLLNRRKHRLFDWYIKFERLFGAKDFIAENPVESVDNLVANKGKYPALARIYDQAAQSDLLVIDGDGDVVFSNPPKREVLFMLAMVELGLRLKKQIFWVNSMVSDCPLTGRNQKTLATARKLFAQCNAVTLRDPESLEFVQREMPEVKCCYVPDSLFAWYPVYEFPTARPPLNGNFLLPPGREEGWDTFDFSVPYVCIGGGALACYQPEKSVPCYTQLVNAIAGLGHRVYLTENDVPDSFLQQVAEATGVGVIPVNAPILMCGSILANARLFISGRYHPSIFASLGGTPCIFLASHAHKMGSLSRVLEYDDQKQFSAFPDASEISGIVAVAKKYLDQGESLRTKIRQVAKLRCGEVTRLPAFIQQQINH